MPNPKNIEKHKWKKGQSGNPKGAPLKTVSFVNAYLEELGYKPVSSAEIKDCYLRLIGLSMPVLNDLLSDPERPILVDAVGRAVKSDRGFEFIEKILDRTIGKPKQSVDMTTNGRDIAPAVTSIQVMYEDGEVMELKSDDI